MKLWRLQEEDEVGEEEEGGPVFIKSVWEAETLNGAFKNMLLGTFLVRSADTADAAVELQHLPQREYRLQQMTQCLVTV